MLVCLKDVCKVFTFYTHCHTQLPSIIRSRDRSIDLILTGEMNKVKVKHAGSCHCGAVKFEVYAPVDLDVVHCRLLVRLYDMYDVLMV